MRSASDVFARFSLDSAEDVVVKMNHRPSASQEFARYSLDSDEDVVVVIDEDGPRFEPDAPAPPASIPRGEAAPGGSKSSLVRRLLAYGAGLFVLAVVVALIWRELTYVYSLRATVMGDLVQQKCPHAGTIVAMKVKVGDTVAAGQLIYELDSIRERTRIDHLRKIREQLQEEVKQARGAVEEEELRIRAFEGAAESRLRMLQAELPGLKAQLAFEAANHKRAIPLNREGVLTDQALDRIATDYAVSRAQVETKEREIDLQKLVIAEVREHKVILSPSGNNPAGSTSQSGLAWLKENLAQRQSALAQAELEISATASAIEERHVVATTAGVVNHVSHLEGDSVTANDYVLSVLKTTSKPFVAARFTFQDARYLQHGLGCKIIVLSQDRVLDGEITAIGNSGLGVGGTVAAADAVADEVPITVDFVGSAPLRSGDAVIVKVARSWTVRGWIMRLQ